MRFRIGPWRTSWWQDASFSSLWWDSNKHPSVFDWISWILHGGQPRKHGRIK